MAKGYSYKLLVQPWRPYGSIVMEAQTFAKIDD